MHTRSRRGGFLLPTNLCSSAYTCMIHFHHLYLCQRIDRYTCRCSPRWRHQQTQTGGEAFFFCSAFWRYWLASSFVYLILFFFFLTVQLKKSGREKPKHWREKKNTHKSRSESVEWEKENESFLSLSVNARCFWWKCWQSIILPLLSACRTDYLSFSSQSDHSDLKGDKCRRAHEGNK